MKTDGLTDRPADETELEQCNAYILRQFQAMGKPPVYGLPSPGGRVPGVVKRGGWMAA
jgi:hypothetical protein